MIPDPLISLHCTHHINVGYELLFRGEMADIGDDAMTATVLSNMFNWVGVDAVTNGYPVFVNTSKKVKSLVLITFRDTFSAHHQSYLINIHWIQIKHSYYNY